MEGVARVKKRDRRYVGRQAPVELALPATPIEVRFEDPTGTKATLGRADARCLVGFRWNGKKLWPFTVYRLPATFEDAEGRLTHALVDVTFHEDASFEFKPHAKGAPALALDKGRLLGADMIENTIAGHLKAARMAKSVSDWFGFDVRRLSASGRRAMDRERSKRARKVAAAKAKEAQAKKAMPTRTRRQNKRKPTARR